MAIRKYLAKAADYDAELEDIEYKIYLLQCMGGILVENDFSTVAVIMETLPMDKNHCPIQPNQYPLYPQLKNNPYMMFAEEEPSKTPPQPIGFTRVYNPDLIESSNMMTISLDIETNLALNLIDQAIKKLRERKRQILLESKKIIKEEPAK